MSFIKVNKKVGANQTLETYLNLDHVQEIIAKQGTTTIVLIRGATFDIKETPQQVLGKLHEYEHPNEGREV